MALEKESINLTKSIGIQVVVDNEAINLSNTMASATTEEPVDYESKFSWRPEKYWSPFIHNSLQAEFIYHLRRPNSDPSTFNIHPTDH